MATLAMLSAHQREQHSLTHPRMRRMNRKRASLLSTNLATTLTNHDTLLYAGTGSHTRHKFPVFLFVYVGCVSDDHAIIIYFAFLP